MLFHIQLVDIPNSAEKREISRPDHWQYFDDHRDNFIARGATTSDDGSVFLSSVLFIQFDDWDAVRSFIDNEPHNRNGVYQDIRINRWNNGLNRTQRDFPRKEGQVCWYIRGHGKPDMHEKRQTLVDAHREYFKPYDGPNFIARGAVLDDAGKKWQGSANLITLPSRQAVIDFLADEPYFMNGLYENILIERYKFGGRPGQGV